MILKKWARKAIKACAKYRAFYPSFFTSGIALLLLWGCSIAPHQLAEGYTSQAMQTAEDNQNVAEVLVGTLRQLDGFEPLAITVQVTPPRSSFGWAITQALRQAGYGMQRVAEDQGSHYISYARTEIVSNHGFVLEYSLRIRDVIVKRRFSAENDNLSPVSPIIVSGVEPQHLHLGHDKFTMLDSGAYDTQGILFELSNGKQASYSTGNALSETPGTTAGRVLSLIGPNAVEAIDLSRYIPVREVLVEFPTADSQILGKRNKATIRELAAGFSAQQDLFTLTGCFRNREKSTELGAAPDQSLLWQTRIKHELMAMGVTRHKIRISACSGRLPMGDLPDRSVILTLRRLKQAT